MRRISSVLILLASLCALMACGEEKVVFRTPDTGGSEDGGTGGGDSDATGGTDGGSGNADGGGAGDTGTDEDGGGGTPGEPCNENADVSGFGGWDFTQEAWDAFVPSQGQTSTLQVILDREETAALPGSVIENVSAFDGVYTQITYGTPAPANDAFRVTLSTDKCWTYSIKAIEVWYNFQETAIANQWVFEDPLDVPLYALVGARNRVNVRGDYMTSGLPFPDYTARLDWTVENRQLNLEVPFGAFREEVTLLRAEVLSSDKPGTEYNVDLYFHPQAGLLRGDIVQEIFAEATLVRSWE